MKCRRDGRARRLRLEKLEARECFSIGEALPPIWEQQLRDVLQHGGELDLPAGKISISQPLQASPEAGPITIRGAGIAKTVIEIDYDAQVPLLSIKNTAAPIQLSGMTLDGNDHRSIGLRLVAVSNFAMTRVELGHFRESAFIGQQLRGARFDDCYFIHNGDAASDSPAVVLDKIDADDRSTDSSGNTFLACRWENNRYVGLRLNRANATDVVGSKFHGTLPNPVPYDHLQLNRTRDTQIIASNFVRAGGDAIQIWESALTDVALNQISQNDGFAVRLINAPNNYVADNEFAPYAPLKNGRGNVLTNQRLLGRPTSSMSAAIDAALTATTPVVEAAATSVSEVVNPLRPGDHLASRLRWGGVFQLEPGIYDLSEPIVVAPGAKLSLQGAGSSKTILRVTGNFPGPAVLVSGTRGMPHKGLEVSGLSVDGMGRDAACFRLDRVMHANFTDVEIRDFDGKAVDGTQFWDSVFRECRFVRCGSEARNVGAVVLRAGNVNEPYTSSNNVMLLGCDFVDNAYTSVEMERLTAKVRILGCEFSQSSKRASRGAVQMERLSMMNVVAANAFENVDPGRRLQDYGAGNIIAASFTKSAPPPVDQPPVDRPPAYTPSPNAPSRSANPNRPLPAVDRDWRLSRRTDEPPTTPPATAPRLPTAPPAPPVPVQERKIIPRRGRFLSRG